MQHPCDTGRAFNTLVTRERPCRFLKHHPGQIKQMVSKLSDGYVGYPARASLVCSWIARLDAVEKGADAHSEGVSGRTETGHEAGRSGVSLASGAIP